MPVTSTQIFLMSDVSSSLFLSYYIRLDVSVEWWMNLLYSWYYYLSLLYLLDFRCFNFGAFFNINWMFGDIEARCLCIFWFQPSLNWFASIFFAKYNKKKYDYQDSNHMVDLLSDQKNYMVDLEQLVSWSVLFNCD